MAGSNDFTGQNIQDTYQRVLQLSSSGQVADGTGSLVPLLDVTASFAISASHEITLEISSSYAETASFIDSTTLDTFKQTGIRTGDGFIGGNITSSGNISASGDIITTNMTASGNISSSGGGLSVKNDITTGNGDVKLRGDKYVKFAADAGFIIGSPATENFKIASGDDENDVFFLINREPGVAEITLTGNITASGDISANGKVTGSTATFTNITASSQISASGGFIGLNLSIPSSTTIINSDGIATIKDIETTGNIILRHITASGNISSSGTIIGNALTLSGLSNQGSEATAIMINGSNIIGTRELGSNAFTSTTIGTMTNALTVDNATLQLDSGTTFDGSAAKTISVKDGGIDSDALANEITLTNLITTNITSSGNISGSTIEGQTLIADVFLSSPSASITNLTNTNITSSGNISASGNIHGVNFIIDEDISVRNISCSGQISASGNIFLHDGSFIARTQHNSLNSFKLSNTGLSHINIIGTEVDLVSMNGSTAVIGNPTATESTPLHISGAGLKIHSISDINLDSADDVHFINDGFTYISAKGDERRLEVVGDISASGNITGSTIEANTGSYHVLQGNTALPTGLDISGFLSATTITASDHISSSILESQTVTADVFLSSPSASITNLTNTNITSSGNISSSGTITANKAVIHNQLTMDGSGLTSNGDLHFYSGQETIFFPQTQSLIRAESNLTVTIGRVNPTNAFFEIREGNTGTGFPISTSDLAFAVSSVGNVTASGAISASGNIHAGTRIKVDEMIAIGSPTTGTLRFGAGANILQMGTPDQNREISLNGPVTASGNISGSLTSVLTIPEIQGRAIVGDQSGSLFLSGSLSFRANEPEPAVSASTLFVKTTPTDNAPDTDLRFSNSGLTPAFAFFSTNGDGDDDANENPFGEGAGSVNSSLHNMTHTFDDGTNGVRAFVQITGTYKIQGTLLLESAGVTGGVITVRKDGSNVLTQASEVHSSVDVVERSYLCVTNVTSGSYIDVTYGSDSSTAIQVKAGSTLLVERLA